MSDTEANATYEPNSAVAGTFDLVATAARDGASDARAAAAHAWALSTRFASRFLYTSCYTISYGVVFPAALLAHAVPKDNAAVRGLIDGAAAARERVVHLGSGLAAEPAAAPMPA